MISRLRTALCALLLFIV